MNKKMLLVKIEWKRRRGEERPQINAVEQDVLGGRTVRHGKMF